jgi:hypothetical protein
MYIIYNRARLVGKRNWDSTEYRLPRKCRESLRALAHRFASPGIGNTDTNPEEILHDRISCLIFCFILTVKGKLRVG